MTAWKLSDDEWNALQTFLRPERPVAELRGRPRIEDTRAVAEACLFRSYHSLSTGRSHCFDWNKLPAEFGVSPSTVNRRFREWNDSGAWARFWTALLKLRGPNKRLRPRRVRKSGSNPVSDLLGELQRAYDYFNQVFFGGILPPEVAITVLRGHGRGDPLGYYCGRAWHWGRNTPTDLIAVSVLAVERGPDAALGTLLHEMVHYRNDHFGLVDCTNHGFYHNRHFRDSAVLAGLLCAERHTTLGYGVTGLGDRARWAIERLHPKGDVFRQADLPE